MKKITITDVTLRESAANQENQLSFKEKIEIAKLLDNLSVNTIELYPIENLKADTLLFKTIATLLKNSSLACPVGMSCEEIDNAWNAISGAKEPKLIVSLPVSTVQMEYICGKKPDKVVAFIKELVSYASEKCPNVEFAAVDATRAEKDFLITSIKTAIAAGAKAVTLCDTAAALLPDELASFIGELKKDIPELEGVTLGVECHDDLKMGVSTAFSCVLAGAEHIKLQASRGVCPKLEEVVDVFSARGDSLGVEHSVNNMILKRTTGQIRRITDAEGSDKASFDNKRLVSEYDGTLLDITANITAVSTAVTKLGYNLSEEDLYNVYEEFIRVAKKKQVGAKELDAIVASTALQVPPTYKLSSYVINSGNIITSTAHIVLDKNGAELSGISAGDGPIDSAFLAVEQIIGHHYELDDFQIFSVTEGKEAMGQALVKLRFDGKLYSGNGISTDIIGASIRAYINALNKIVYEEKNI